MSVVDTMKNEVVGEPLKAWKEYADPAKFPNLPEDQVKFSVTVPDLMGKCAKPGRCVCSAISFLHSVAVSPMGLAGWLKEYDCVMLIDKCD